MPIVLFIVIVLYILLAKQTNINCMQSLVFELLCIQQEFLPNRYLFTRKKLYSLKMSVSSYSSIFFFVLYEVYSLC